MAPQEINIRETIKDAQEMLDTETGISPAFRSMFKLLLVLVQFLADKHGLNSRNSSKPPSSDPNREKNKKPPGKKNPGGQKGHKGTTLTPVDDPDEVLEIAIDRSTLPEGTYTEAGYEARQVFDVIVERHVLEYRAQVLVDQNGKRFVAPFPDEVANSVQYGRNTKVNSVYMSQYQLLPYERIRDYFISQMRFPLSAGSVYNFNQAAYQRLKEFEQWLKSELINSTLNHADETGINIGGKRQWLHGVSNKDLTYLYSHAKRGSEAMVAGGVIPHFQGILVHDHWKPYYKYSCTHALCNAHHLRELERAREQDNQQWAASMQKLLLEIHKAVNQTAVGKLSEDEIQKYLLRYRKIIEDGEAECPLAIRPPGDKRRGKLKQSKARNLLDRLKNFESDVLRFMVNEIVPFSNNSAERDLRMTKVQQKISGCFRSTQGAEIFCRIRSYLSTCMKQDVSPNEALTLLFMGKYPDFVSPDYFPGSFPVEAE